MRTNLNRMLTTGALKRMDTNTSIVDLVSKEDDSFDRQLQLKNLCAKVSKELSDEVDSMCAFLDISKRRFIEAAIIEALRQADEVIAEEGLEEYHVQQTDQSSLQNKEGK